jgi:hypothetical protein
LPYHPKVEGSSLGPFSCLGREKMAPVKTELPIPSYLVSKMSLKVLRNLREKKTFFLYQSFLHFLCGATTTSITTFSITTIRILTVRINDTLHSNALPLCWCNNAVSCFIYFMLIVVMLSLIMLNVMFLHIVIFVLVLPMK